MNLATTTVAAAHMFMVMPAVAATQHAGNLLPLRPQPAYAAFPYISASNWIDADLQKLVGLSRNWDGYGADPISRQTLSAMRQMLVRLLPSPATPGSIVPGADGSLQAEWHLGDTSFGLLIERDGSIECWVDVCGVEDTSEGLAAEDMFRALANANLAMRPSAP